MVRLFTLQSFILSTIIVVFVKSSCNQFTVILNFFLYAIVGLFYIIFQWAHKKYFNKISVIISHVILDNTYLFLEIIWVLK